MLIITHFQGYWQTNIDGIYINGQEIAGNIATIIDSGTAMILGDTKTVQAFYNQIPGSYLIGSGYYSCTAGYFIESQKDRLTLPFDSSLLIRFRNLSPARWYQLRNSKQHF